jgi:hypothetical protein
MRVQPRLLLPVAADRLGASRKRAVSDPTVCYPQTRSGQRAASALTHPLLVDPAQGVGLLLERLCGSQLFIHDR